jgi:hypothetical protein
MTMPRALLVVLALGAGCASVQPGRLYPTPEAAAAALLEAARSGSTERLNEVLGSDGDELLSSGDAVSDEQDRKMFVGAYEKKHSLTKEADGTLTLVVGEKEWPFPIPLVQVGGGWRFDTELGRDELISRRVGRNELNTIEVCRALVEAQEEYAQLAIGGTAQYARKILSSPGKRDGLYWETAEKEAPSPLGPLVAQASEEGYAAAIAERNPGVYHGYRYRVLTKQGPAAKGGERDYVVENLMIGGFAFVAYPAEYGESGVMTFIVNHEGIVYQSDLGEDTAKLASRMPAFDPGPTWKRVD